jgi:hypothetical protein
MKPVESVDSDTTKLQRRNRTIATLRADNDTQKETIAWLKAEQATLDYNEKILWEKIEGLRTEVARSGAEFRNERHQPDRDRAELEALRKEKKMWTEVNANQKTLEKLTQGLSTQVKQMLSHMGVVEDGRTEQSGRGSTQTRRCTPLYLEAIRTMQRAVADVCSTVAAFPNVSEVIKSSRASERRMQQAQQKCAGLQAWVEQHKSKKPKPEQKRPATITPTRDEKARSFFLCGLIRIIRTRQDRERDGGHTLSIDAPHEQPEALRDWGNAVYQRSYICVEEAVNLRDAQS